MTTLQLLDAVEAGLAALRSQDGHTAGAQTGPEASPQNGHAPAGRNGHGAEADGAGPMAPSALNADMARAALSARQFAALVGVGREEVEDWVAGRAAIPSWVPAAVRLLALLTPSAMRTLLNGGAKTQRPARTHPFSRIEEL